MDLDDRLDLLAIDQADRADCAALFARSGDDALVAEVVASITRSMGSFNEIPVGEPTQEPLVWLAAYLRLVPALVEWHREHGIAEAVTRDTLADVGRHVAISRRVTGEFGLQTWRWLGHHYSARLFALGRLQFALQRTSRSVPGMLAPGDWALEAHIPESGPLLPALVDESLNRARAFFAVHFPDRPVTVVTCNSWMLDPFLADRVAATSNVGAFIRRFTPFGESSDGHTDALYFVFRTRDLDRVPTLPRDTSLQRAVLERLDRGESWQIAWGYLRL
ncbi:hypothetical protein HD599_003140 [Conyzicola lurida]|uniref:GNAT-like C-terminal domain-containing protein n=1 Tax=Conyzicola lurida TaxID=1172621 RepID=A0A841ANP9_9MICO|nr:acyltransferase domain-containing protein [Conyzicola lurida]MBB5844817.1 hypothetical protein [Conyzicola lurida]